MQVVGCLADKVPAVAAPVRGVLVRQGLHDSIMAPEDLPVFTKLRPGRILQQQTLLLSQSFSQVLPPAQMPALVFLYPSHKMVLALFLDHTQPSR